MAYDAVYQLLDRQVVDVDGLLVGKVDDVELVEDADGALVPTGLMIGMAAVLPRFGRGLYRLWVALAPADAARSRPGVVEIDLVGEVSSEVRLTVPRAGLVRRRLDTPGAPTRYRLGQLLDMPVELPDRRVRVLDVRLTEQAHAPGTRVSALLVGHGRPGSYLGYERSPDRGPWLVAAVVRRLHRHSRVVELGSEVEIDWEAGVVRVAG